MRSTTTLRIVPAPPGENPSRGTVVTSTNATGGGKLRKIGRIDHCSHLFARLAEVQHNAGGNWLSAGTARKQPEMAQDSYREERPDRLRTAILPVAGIQISEKAVGVRILFVIRDTISLSAYSGIARSFCHSASSPKLPGGLAGGIVGKRQHVCQIRHRGADHR